MQEQLPRDGVKARGSYISRRSSESWNSCLFWYSEETNQYHLKRQEAKNLLSGTLQAYYEQKGKTLKEIFLHSRLLIEEQEWSGYRDACPKGVKLGGGFPISFRS